MISNSDQAQRQYGDSTELMPKFLYLKALSVGKVDVVDSLAAVLKEIIVKYPSSEIAPMAQDLLSYVAKDRPDLGAGMISSDSEEPPELVSPYSYDPDTSLHRRWVQGFP